MKKSHRHIASSFLLVLFLSPFILKSQHHHDSPASEPAHEQHYHTTLEKCAICSFEFSVFSSDFNKIRSQKDLPDILFFSHYRSLHFSNSLAFSFLLRGPPARVA